MKEMAPEPELPKMNLMTFNGKKAQSSSLPGGNLPLELTQPTGSGLREPKFIPQDFGKKKAALTPTSGVKQNTRSQVRL